MPGWIKLHRQLMDHPIWIDEPFTRGQAWVDLLLWARHENGQVRRRGARVKLRRGEVGVSERFLAKRWKWSRGKVRRFLDELKTDHQIDHKGDGLKSVIVVINYDSYQSDGPPNSTEDGTANGPQTGHRRATDSTKNKNEKKEENEKNEKKRMVVPTIEEVEAFVSEGGHNVDPHHFWNYYEAQGWLLANGRRMKSWKSAVVTWTKNGRGNVPVGKGF